MASEFQVRMAQKGTPGRREYFPSFSEDASSVIIISSRRVGR